MTDAQLEQWLAQDPDNIDQWLLDGLRIGCELLDLETGIVSQIKGQDYIIHQTHSRLGDIFSPGDAFELENTYCEAVSKGHKTITYIQVGAIPEMRLHPVYVAVQLESYIGSPIFDKQKNVIGTINFSSHASRDDNFTIAETEITESMARRISEVLQRQ